MGEYKMDECDGCISGEISNCYILRPSYPLESVIN